MEYPLSECVIVIKSGEESTSLHKEIRQAYEVVIRLAKENPIFVSTPNPTRVFIETYKKEDELWIKIVFDGHYVLCDIKCPPNSIFDLEGNIKCRHCEQTIDVTLPKSSRLFEARFPRIVIHVKRQPEENPSIQPAYLVKTSLHLELIECLELLIQSICEGCDESYHTPIKHAIFTKLIPKDDKNDPRLAKVFIEDPEDPLFEGEQMNGISTITGYVECDHCGFTFD